MADNDSYEKDMEEIFGETRGERERKRLKQISDAAAESVRLANDFKQELKKEEIQSDDPIIQKCLDIIRNEKTIVIKPFQKYGDFYVAYIKNGEIFSFVPEYSILSNTWTDTIRINNDKQPSIFYGKRSSDLIELHKLCDEKYFKRKETQKEWRRKYYPIILASALGVGMLVFGWSRIHKKDNVDKQVEAYEKTLPAEYLEYKQAVEHYRDSLMHAKRR